jgi:hypothetical protein
MLFSSATALAEADWLNSFIDGMTKILDIIPEWNKAIDKITNEEKRKQFRRRLHRIAKDLRALEIGKQDLIDSLLSSNPDVLIIKDDIADLRKTVHELSDNLEKITVELNLQNAFDGWEVESELDKDLNEKSQYLNRIEQLVGLPGEKIPEEDLAKIKRNGDHAIATIQSARKALKQPLKVLEVGQ